MAATMQDVARLAGVSTKTVSNVVNDFPHVRPETRERVRSAIAKLGYEVNISARNLRRGSTGVIGLALPELKLPYFAELADSVIAEAERQGLRVMIEQTGADRRREIEVLQGLTRSMTDGLIFSPLALGQDDIALFRVDFPLVVLGERVFEPTNDHVTMSNVDAAHAATQHLLDRGCRRIALVGTHPGEELGTASLRERGFREAMSAAGVEVDEELVVAMGPWNRGAGATAAEDLLRSGRGFDGVFALNDGLAIGVLHVLHAHGVAVPDDVALIGFDDVEDAQYTSPTLSSVAAGREEIARVAVEMLRHRISEAGVPAVDRDPIRRVFAGYTVRSRESTAV